MAKAKSVSQDRYVEPKSCRIEKASNGFIVNHGWGSKQMIAKTLPEAQKLQAQYLK